MSDLTPGTADMVCEAHPELSWPHGDCAGPGCPLSAKDHLQWWHRRNLEQELATLKHEASELGRAYRAVVQERDTLARRVEELERSLKGETARKQAFERVVSNSRTVVQGLLALVKGECWSAVEDCIDVILAERYLDETTERCRICGGSGVVAQKRTIEDGWGEVDACPRCCPAPPVRD